MAFITRNNGRREFIPEQMILPMPLHQIDDFRFVFQCYRSALYAGVAVETLELAMGKGCLQQQEYNVFVCPYFDFGLRLRTRTSSECNKTVKPCNEDKNPQYMDKRYTFYNNLECIH